MNNIYFVILSGGSGTRLWPLSRKNKPKQLLPFLNNKSLLEQTIERISPLTNSKANIGIITTEEQALLIPEEINNKLGFVLQEPSARNTAPAILYSALNLAQNKPNAVVVFLPADHFIPETDKFRFYLQSAINHAQATNDIVTLGLIPTNPATGYGYIQAKTQVTPQAGTAYAIEKFHEKPSQEKALEYMIRNDMFWNLGMFVGKASAFIDAYKTYAPDIYTPVCNYIRLGNAYDTSPSISIDYAIMEKVSNASVIPCDFAWNDVGNLDVFLSLQQQSAPVLSLNGSHNIAYSESNKVIACLGLDNCCIIETKDAILVAKRSDIENVKNVIPLIKEKNFDQLL